ncbi:hypothetical protein OIO90_002410 [Microbotryomycetes sp. JL221]|nr:hypothetical protein OIO90_002410 [Microbotryomycetes sp. JL221]
MLVHSVSQHAHALSDLRSAQRDQELLMDQQSAQSTLATNCDRSYDTLNSHSRQVEMSPMLGATESRRLSRLPTSLGPLDPFGYDVGLDSTPYDSAFTPSIAAANKRNSSRTPLQLSPSSPMTSAGLAQQTSFPSSSSMMSIASSSSRTALGRQSSSFGSTSTNASSNTSSHGQLEPRPWIKTRSSSWGDQAAARSQFRNGLSAPSTGNRSKLSGEIIAETMSVVEMPVSAPPKIDYTSSRLYQRTLKAQKALEKDRAKAAAKGKVSKYDVPDLKTLAKQERRQSAASSFVSDIGIMASRSRSSLGWFRSSSEATLAIPPSPTIPAAGVSSSRSSATLLSLQSSVKMPPQPDPPVTAISHTAQQQQQPLKPVKSQDRLREAREAVGVASPPRSSKQRGAVQSLQSAPTVPTKTGLSTNVADTPIDRAGLKPRQSSLMPGSMPITSSLPSSRTPSPLSMAEVSEALMQSPRTNSAYVSCNSSSKAPSLEQETHADGSPSPSSSSPSTPPLVAYEVYSTAATPLDARPSLPRSRKSSFNLFGGSKKASHDESQLQVTAQPSKMTKSRTSLFSRSAKSSAPPSSATVPPVACAAKEASVSPAATPLKLSKSKFGWFGTRTRSKSMVSPIHSEKQLPPPPPPIMAAAVLRRG